MEEKLIAMLDKVAEKLDGMNAKTESLAQEVNELKKSREIQNKFDPAERKAPSVITGACGVDSDGYSIARAIKAAIAKDWSNAKYEKHIHQTLIKKGLAPETGGFMVPLSSEVLRKEEPGLKAAMAETVEKTAIGYTTGGGATAITEINQPFYAKEVIDILRANTVLFRAGVREIPMPSSNLLTIPRIATGVTAYWKAENTALTESAFDMNSLSLTAKKLTALQIVSNELLADSNPSIEAILREDIAKKFATEIDRTILDGSGVSPEPAGVIDSGLCTSVSSSGTGANGDTFSATDAFSLWEAVMNAKGVFKSFIAHPKTFSRYLKLRADAVAGSDAAGAFLFMLQGQTADPFLKEMVGYPCWLSTNVPVDRTKGAGTTLTTLYGGDWSQIIFARKEAIEIDASEHVGFSSYVTYVRAVLRADLGFAQGAAIGYMDALVQ